MRYKMIVSYDGSFFHGFQRQKNDVSVQEVLEEKLTEILKTNIVVHASGRTDAGVHAIVKLFILILVNMYQFLI